MKKWIHAATEADYLKRIPKKHKQYIVSIDVSDSDDYNNRGQRLKNYIVTWDNDDEHTFQNVEQMIWTIKEYTGADGYFYGA